IVLNSGSNGNAVYVESASTGSAVLLDCGLSQRAIDSRLRRHERSGSAVRAVVLTHEHSDHVKGVHGFVKKYNTPLHATRGTFHAMSTLGWGVDFRPLRAAEPMSVDDISIHAFPKSHDAEEPVFLKVSTGGKTFLYVTDLGVPAEDLATELSTADALMIESNYDPDMLWNGGYPTYLKTRIDGPFGHLSNAQAVSFLEAHANGRLKVLILGHLSRNNNTPRHVEAAVQDLMDRRHDFRPRVLIASRDSASDVILL
ncbi:MAG: MBL fold metallo-hydrolase, partial [Bacteroidota bacterium]|nr:MBL fold metallo-hydrolase [Bacteroidota bacterium]